MGILLVLAVLTLWASLSAVAIGAMRFFHAARHFNAQRVVFREIERHRGGVPVGAPR